MKRAWLLLCALVLVPGPAAQAEDDGAPDYTLIPPSIGSVLVNQRTRALGAAALRLLEEAEHTDTAWHDVPTRAAQLTLLGAPGLRLIAERLSVGDTSTWLRRQLLHVVAQSEHEGADHLLALAARERDAALRMIAADGLSLDRTPRAVPVLTTLLRDPLPGVRMAALRALFALDTVAAREARVHAPEEIEAHLLARRLIWHQRAGDDHPVVLRLASAALAEGSTPALRTAAAALLVDPHAGAHTASQVLEEIAQEFAPPTWLPPIAPDRPLAGADYDLVEGRRIAISATLALLDRASTGPALRQTCIARAMGWIADPVEMDPFSKGVPRPEIILKQRLPDLGQEILTPMVQAIERRTFRRAEDGFLLLRELGRDVALPWVRTFLWQQLEAGVPKPHPFTAGCAALADLGEIGDEALARRLFLDPPRTLREGTRQSVRQYAGVALRTDPAPWVVPLVAEGLSSPDNDLEHRAQSVLAARTEPEAWAARVQAFFRQPTRRGHDRLDALVARGDDRAFDIMKRALADKRRVVRSIALQRFHRNAPALHDAKRFLPLVQATADKLRTAHDIQYYLRALLVLGASEEAVAYVRRTWDTMPNENAREVSLRQLQDVRGAAAVRAAIDLALDKVATAGPNFSMAAAAILHERWKHRPDDVVAFWKRLLHKDHPRRWTAVRMVAHRGAADLTDMLLPIVDEIWKTDELPKEDEDDTRLDRIDKLVDALGYQPREKVMHLLLDAALDPLLPTDGARITAIRHLKGRIDEPGRLRLIKWLGYALPSEDRDTPPLEGEGSHEDGAMHWLLAQVVGTGADSDVAAALLKTFDHDLKAWTAAQPTLAGTFLNAAQAPHDPRVAAQLAKEQRAARAAAARLLERLRALARAVAETRHTPSISALMERLFDPGLVAIAQLRVQRFAGAIDGSGAGAAAMAPAPLDVLDFSQDNLQSVALDPPSNIVGQLKVLPDERLAPLLEAALQRARDRGVLARAPPIYLALLCGNFLDRGGGACPQTARLLLDATLDAPPRDNAVALRALGWMIDALEDRKRYEEQVVLTERSLRIVARRHLDTPDGLLLRRKRTHHDAVRGTVLARAGRHDEARASFRRALLRAPNHPGTLNTVAWYLYAANFDLGWAEDLARRAARLDERGHGAVSLYLADTLACILRARGKAAEGLRIFESRLASVRSTAWTYHLHHAQLLAAVGDLEHAAKALTEALILDRRLADRLDGDAALAPLKPRFAAIVRTAQRKRER